MADLSGAPFNGTWDYATLPANVALGVGCFLERRNSFERFRSQRNPGLVIGDHTSVYTWSVFNVEPTGLVTIGARSEIVGAVFMCAERIDVGADVVIAYGVTIADSDFHPHDLESRRQDAIALAPGGHPSARSPLLTRPVVIEDGAWIGIGAIILKGATIGRGARVAAGSVVSGAIPPGASVAGNPARVIEQGE